MVSLVPVEDADDPRLADYVGLTDAARRRRVEDGGGFFIAEGVLAIRSLLGSPYPVRSLLVSAARLETLAGDLEGLDVPIYVAPAATLEAVAGFPVHRGALASAGRLAMPPVEQLLAGARLVVVAEAINDHENLGALFRNAAAFGAQAVLLCPRCCDPLYRRSVRVSLGHVLRVHWTRLEPWPAALATVSGAGLEVVALTPDAAADPVADLEPGRRRAVLVGAEGPGLTAGALAAADRRARIPMAPGVDSLNVATAAAVALSYLTAVR